MPDDETRYDIAVIGAGAAGLSVAYFLAAHARVVVLEREDQPAYHSSGRSAAMYIEGYENRAVQALTKAGADFFFSAPDGFADYPLVTPCGGLTVAGPGETDALQKYLDVWQPSCPELVALSAQDTINQVPVLREDWVSGGAFDPSWHNIDVHGLLSGYQRGIRAQGGAIQTNAHVTDLSWRQDHWRIATGTGELRADIVVNTAGAWANHVGAMAGLDALPLTPMRRTAAIVAAPPDSRDWPLVHTINESLYFKPEGPGLMVCPQDETPSEAMDVYPEELDIAIAMDRFAQVTDHAVDHVMRSWAGLRTFAPDRHPIVGFAPNARGFFWLVGQGGFGVQTSPGLGEHAADIILERTSPMNKIDVTRINA